MTPAGKYESGNQPVGVRRFRGPPAPEPGAAPGDARGVPRGRDPPGRDAVAVAVRRAPPRPALAVVPVRVARPLQHPAPPVGAEERPRARGRRVVFLRSMYGAVRHDPG